MRKIVITKPVLICNLMMKIGDTLEVLEYDLVYHKDFGGHSGAGTVGDKYINTKYEGHLWFVPLEIIEDYYKEATPLTLENK